jgi:hypothetical protein
VRVALVPGLGEITLRGIKIIGRGGKIWYSVLAFVALVTPLDSSLGAAS